MSFSVLETRYTPVGGPKRRGPQRRCVGNDEALFGPSDTDWERRPGGPCEHVSGVPDGEGGKFRDEWDVCRSPFRRELCDNFRGGGRETQRRRG